MLGILFSNLCTMTTYGPIYERVAALLGTSHASLKLRLWPAGKSRLALKFTPDPAAALPPRIMERGAPSQLSPRGGLQGRGPSLTLHCAQSGRGL